MMALTQGAMNQIGRYKILGEVGRGAMGIVYRAQDPAIGRVVAIKMIRLGDLGDPSEHAKLRERLMREAQSAGILSHPGIVTIYDVGEQDGLAYISMEYVDGPTLERMMRNDPPDGRLVLDILTQTAAALDYAHKRGIVHRDIKPANIMIHERMIAKITDFGVARIQSHQMTQAGSMVGTPNYMSPEQIQGHPVDGRSDQFSLAVIAYELLTGEKPFQAESIPSLAFKIVQEEPQQVHRLNPTLDWPVDTVLKRALSKDPADRYPTCSDFVFAIENACRSSKKWKPVPAGALQNLPTLAGAAGPSAATPAKPLAEKSKAQPSVKPMAAGILNPPVEPRSETPRLLRWARALALMIVSAVVIIAGIFGVLHFMEDDNAAAPKSAQDETAVVSAPKPSATPAEPESATPAPKADTPPDVPSPVTDETQPSTETQPSSTARKTDRAKPKPGPTMTRMVTNPPGVFLVVDGSSQYSCTTPCSMELPPGRHTIVATREGYRRTLKIFETPGSDDVFLNLDRTSGTLLVRSEPRGADIIVDGQSRSEKTPAMLSLATGRHSIEVQQANRKVTQEVVIHDSAITNLAVDLQ
jgi:serine/threonine protein kinase